MEGQPGCGPDTPAGARVYDYWAGGRDYHRADKDLADDITGVCPGIPRMARDARLFAARAVRDAAAAGISQFLDLGCGYPPEDPGIVPLHETARAVNAAASVAYVDVDEDVAGLATWEYLTSGKLEGISVTCADLRDVTGVLRDERLRLVIFPGQPVAVVASMVFHFMAPEQAAAAAAGYMRALAPGSLLIATTARNDDALRWGQVRDEWEQRTGQRIWNYTQDEFAALFGGLEPEVLPGPAGPHGLLYALAGTGRKPGA
jgi:hypothetical protein